MDLELIPDKRVSYYFDEEIGIYTFKKGHPMRPLRIKITDELVRSYGMDKLMTCYDSTFFEMDDKDFMNFHSEEYIDLLKNINEENLGMYQDQFTRFGFSADCPHPSNSKFYDFCKLYTSGSILGSKLLNQKKVDVAINWSGGLHHAKRQEASGFCYVNDCVLAIIEMLKVYPRVLYLDIDVHHGDGVEEAFFTTDRVLTCSFHHKYKDFFPGTGDHKDIGFERGKYHAVNFPLREGIDDLTYEHIFKPVLDGIIESFNPSAILMQCGSDSLSGDKLGCFNLSISGHGKCVEYIKKTGIPLLLTGGGGYTLRNIPRCWTYETSLALDFPIDNKIPDNQYVDYFYPEGTLHTPISNMDNLNSNEKLHDITNQILEHLRTLERFNPDTTVEHKYGIETENKLLEEKANINQEINEELSEKNQNTNQEIKDELLNNLKYVTHTQSINVSDSIQEKLRRFFFYNRFLKQNIENLKEEFYFEIEQDITQEIDNKIYQAVENHLNERKYLILEQILGKKLTKEKQKINILDNLYQSIFNWKINIEKLNNYLLKLDFYNQNFSEKFITGCLKVNKNKKAKKNLNFQNYIHVFLLKAISMLIKNVDIPGSVVSGKGKIINYIMLIMTTFGGQFQFTKIIKNFSTLNIALPAIITTMSFLKGFMAQKIEIQLSNEELKIYSQILIKEIDKQNNFIEETLNELETKFQEQMMAKLTKDQMKSDKALIEITRILEYFVKNKKYEKYDYNTQFSEKQISVKEENNFIVIDEL